MTTTTGGGRAVSTILLATAIAGVAGYVIQLVLVGTTSDEQWVRISAFWSTLYLIVAGLSGIQQEVGRATLPVRTTRPTGALKFTLWASGGLAVVLGLSGLVWAPHLFVEGPWVALIAMIVGAVGYVAVAVLCGVLYGIEFWRAVAGMMIIDAVLRVVMVVPITIFADSVPLTEWAVVLPFPLSVLLYWPFIRHRVRGSFTLDVGLPRLSWNVSRTVVATIATGVLVSGFPLVFQATSQHDPIATRATLIALVMLTRAPIVIPLMALQSLLISRFRGNPHTGTLIVKLLAAVAVGSVALGLLAAWLGPWILGVIYGDKYAGVGGLLIGAVVVTAGATAALCVTGSAVLARGLHSAFVAGWVVSALALIAILLLPLPVEPRAITALGVAPLLGLAVHAVTLVRTRAEAPVIGNN
ncbi:hypothetical protein [Mycetocola saprophilus]|uniref:hypothetical protein n=1 Tax=Mycetocola saprophilus TaxID=76636 RepID=UPI00068E1FDF|nr:hypothetical protein [Mycetocola saprophilus]